MLSSADLYNREFHRFTSLQCDETSDLGSKGHAPYCDEVQHHKFEEMESVGLNCIFRMAMVEGEREC